MAHVGFKTFKKFIHFRCLAVCSRHAKIINPWVRWKSSHTDTLYDVVISGGGMVGAAMTASLAQQPMFDGKKILLLEAGPQKRFDQLPQNYRSRTCALNLGAVELLSKFGAWDNILNMRCQEVKRMQIWDSCSGSMLAFNNKNLAENLAYIAENDVILAGINQQVDKLQDKADVMYNARVKDYQFPFSDSHTKEMSPWVQLHMANGDRIETKLLIGTDGFSSLARKTADIHTLQWDYKQSAVVATLHIPEDPYNNAAWQRFLKTGPIAMLPISDKFNCLIWSTTRDHARQLLELSEESFVDAVNTAFWSEDDKIPVAENVSKLFDQVLTTVGLDGSTSRQLPPTVIGVDAKSRGAFPLTFSHATHYVKPRLALVGDAAHRIHPLAGQGVNLGFGDVSCLTEKLVKAVHDGTDIGALGHLLEYESERQKHAIPVMAACDGLQKLYNTSITPVVILRTLGLQATNALGSLKEKMIRVAAT